MDAANNDMRFGRHKRGQHLRKFERKAWAIDIRQDNYKLQTKPGNYFEL